jgi:exodeoxyribonuclease VII large subunit
VAACQTPIVSAVGHETDVSIADFVADVRAPTPSAAAELLAPDSGDLQRRLDGLQRRLALRMQHLIAARQMQIDGLRRRLRHPGERLRQQAQRLDDLELRLQRAMSQRLRGGQDQLGRLETRLAAQHPERLLGLLRQRLEHLGQRLPRAMQTRLREHRQKLEAIAQTLQVVSPLAPLGRGYRILLDDRGRAVRRAADTAPGQRLSARLHEGELKLRVEETSAVPATLELPL